MIARILVVLFCLSLGGTQDLDYFDEPIASTEQIQPTEPQKTQTPIASTEQTQPNEPQQTQATDDSALISILLRIEMKIDGFIESSNKLTLETIDEAAVILPTPTIPVILPTPTTPVVLPTTTTIFTTSTKLPKFLEEDVFAAEDDFWYHDDGNVKEEESLAVNKDENVKEEESLDVNLILYICLPLSAFVTFATILLACCCCCKTEKTDAQDLEMQEKDKQPKSQEEKEKDNTEKDDTNELER